MAPGDRLGGTDLKERPRKVPPESVSPETSRGQPRERPLVLVVEDDDSTRESLIEYLGDYLDVMAASDGELAIQEAREHRPDVILMDLSLPGRDGVSALEELHKDARTRGVPVIFVSSHRDERTVVRCLDLGAEDFLTKPAGARELLARIERSLRHARERKELQALAQLDALTGLYNYRLLYERLDSELARAQRYGHPLASMMLDLDHLKQINDERGHELGNEAIRLVARQLRSQLREVDFAARYGGDEFAVLVPHKTDQEARILAERLRVGLLNNPLQTADGPIVLTMSVGIAAHQPGSLFESAASLLDAADAALYQAKQQGRNRVVVAEIGTGMMPTAVDRP